MDETTNYTELDSRFDVVLHDLTHAGVPVSVEQIRTLAQVMKSEMEDLTSAINKDAGWDVRISSPLDIRKYLSKITGIQIPDTTSPSLLFNEANLQNSKIRTLHTARRTRYNISILDKLFTQLKDPIRPILQPVYRRAPGIARVHTAEVNIQNWPKEIRHIVTLHGHNIVNVDYCRIELKVLAHLANDRALKAALETDPYVELAKTHYDTPTPTPEQRHNFKTALLGLIYGQSSLSLAESLGCSRETAIDLHSQIRHRFPATGEFRRQIVRDSEVLGYAVSMHGRNLKIDSHSPSARERLIFNNKIQSSSAEVAQAGTTLLYEHPDFIDLGGRPIAFVHDSFVFAIPTTVPTTQIESLIQETMVTKNHPSIDLQVSISIDSHW